MTKTLGEIVSIGSDILGLVPGFQWAPLVGNTVGGGIAGGPEGALLGGATSFAGGQIGQELGQLGSQAGSAITGAPLPTAEGLQTAADVTGLSTKALSADASNPVENILSTAGTAAGPLVTSQTIEPALASALGINQTGGAPAPTSQATPKSTGSGGAGPGAPPGGLALTGSTAPQIFPWAGAQSPLNQAINTIASGPAQQPQGKGI